MPERISISDRMQDVLVHKMAVGINKKEKNYE